MELNIELINKRMKKLGLTPYTLAKKIGMTYESVRYILRKKSTKLQTIAKIAVALKVREKNLLI